MKKEIDIILKAKNNVGPGVDAAQRKLGKLRTGFSKLMGAAKKYGHVVIAAVTAAIGAMVRLGKAALKAYEVQAQSEAKLRAAIRATGYVVGISTKELKAYAAELQKTTGFADEVTLSMMGILATFRNIKGGEMFKRSTAAILDMAAAMGKAGKGSADVESAVIQIGKALNDPISQLGYLSRVGIVFTDQQREQIRNFAQTNQLAKAQAIILSELETEFGGVAAAMHEADTGTKNLVNNWSDLKEAFGLVFKEGLKLEGFFKKLSSAVEDFKEAIQPIDIKSLKEDAEEIIGTKEAEASRERQRIIDEQMAKEKEANKFRVKGAMFYLKSAIEMGEREYAEFADRVNRMAEKSKEFHEKRREEAEETKNKIAELEEERAETIRKQEEENTRGILEENKKRLAEAKRMNNMTIQQIMEEAKALKKKKNVRKEEDDRAKKLNDKIARGITLSKRDQEWLNAWERRDIEGQNVGKFAADVAGAEDQLEAIKDTGKKLDDIKTELENENKKLNKLLTMG
jgi:hypothetical protein